MLTLSQRETPAGEIPLQSELGVSAEECLYILRCQVHMSGRHLNRNRHIFCSRSNLSHDLCHNIFQIHFFHLRHTHVTVLPLSDIEVVHHDQLTLSRKCPRCRRSLTSRSCNSQSIRSDPAVESKSVEARAVDYEYGGLNSSRQLCNNVHVL